MNTILGNRIEQIRKVREMTQEAVADALSCSRQRYARMEKGEIDITYSDLKIISQLFKVSVSDITSCVEDNGQDGFAALYRSASNSDINTSLDTIGELLDFFYALKRQYERVKGIQL
jgi:transcriptional regulator with XRE-family HTH domain